MQERSEAERRAIWPCLNVATWRRERSDRDIQQTYKPPRFSLFANLYRSAGFLQIFADMCRFEKKDILRITQKTQSDVKRIVKMFKTREKFHLCQNDETFFCSILYRSVEITDLYRSLQSQTMTDKLL